MISSATFTIPKLPASLVSIAKNLALYVIPYLLGFIAASFQDLRIWIALEKAVSAPSPDVISGNPSTRRSRGRWCIVPVFIMLLGAYASPFIIWFYSVIPHNNQNFNQHVGLATLYVGLFYIMERFLSRICGLNSIAVHRTPNGGYLTLGVQNSDFDWRHTCVKILVFSSSFLVLLSLAATYTSEIIPVIIVTTAIVHLVSRSFFGKTSVWKMFKLYFLIMTTLAVLISLLCLLSHKLGWRPLESISTLLGPNWSRMIFVLPASSSAFVGGLIARILRFDYQRHLDGPGCDHEIDSMTVPAPTIDNIFYNKEELPEGVLVPQRAPSAFLKPYFTIALVAWSFVRIIAVHLGLGGLFTKTQVPTVRFIVILSVEFPVVVIVLILYATSKKEAKALLIDDENWKLPETKGVIALPFDDTAIRS